MEIRKQEFENQQQEIEENALDQVSGGKAVHGQYMDVYCSECGQSFTANVSLNMAICSHCGVPIRLF